VCMSANVSSRDILSLDSLATACKRACLLRNHDSLKIRPRRTRFSEDCASSPSSTLHLYRPCISGDFSYDKVFRRFVKLLGVLMVREHMSGSWEIFLESNSLKRKFLGTHLYENSRSILSLPSTIPYETHSLKNPEGTFC